MGQKFLCALVLAGAQLAAALQPVRTTLRRTALRAGELAQSDLQKTPPKAGIQFYDDLWESTVPDVKLTRSPDAQTGVAKFFFAKPSFFNCASESDIPSGAISAMTMVDEEGRMSTTNVDANFVNGLPQTISVTYVMYSPAEWERFLRFMGSYAEVNGLGFKKS
ncbi:Psb28 protein-domain-containing protein [Pelagophyceae sp. CCMP2097]|nr:Psb28 protein-domain-containing protein [Pelagophyceae sp. CCMP2097]|mmetsp:Transcript_24085/g.81171  ORF Transcript_24085/g.81171 Transcript_24085/m.81171 type:complete len:164 (+) Transcript_24085:149-640(+)